MSEYVKLRPLADGEAYIVEADPSFNISPLLDTDGHPRSFDITPGKMIVIHGRIRIATIVDGQIVSVE